MGHSLEKAFNLEHIILFKSKLPLKKGSCTNLQ